MSYRIDLLTSAADHTVLDSLFPPAVTVRGWGDRVSGPGKCVFSMNRDNPAATDENLRLWRPLTLYRKPEGESTLTPIWAGFILAKREVEERVEVVCEGALKILAKRETAASETFTGQGAAEAFGLLTDCNGTGQTGITQGTGGVTTTVNLTLDRVQALRALEQIAAASGGEFRVTPEWALDFTTGLGSDKSGTVELIFQRDGRPGSNVARFEIAEDGEAMANRVIGVSSAVPGYESVYDHPTSTPDYPLLIERRAFNEANNSGTLDALTEAYGGQHGLPIPDFVAQPLSAAKRFNPLTGARELSGLSYGDVAVGDLVTVTVVTGSKNVSVVKRVAEIAVEVDENLREQLKFTFSEPGVFVTGRSLDETAFADLKRRVQELERLV